VDAVSAPCDEPIDAAPQQPEPRRDDVAGSSFTCRVCRQPIARSARELAFFAERNWSEPSRCGPCKAWLATPLPMRSRLPPSLEVAEPIFGCRDCGRPWSPRLGLFWRWEAGESISRRCPNCNRRARPGDVTFDPGIYRVDLVGSLDEPAPEAEAIASPDGSQVEPADDRSS
jgi:hypothetical protein